MKYSSKPAELKIVQERITSQVGRGNFPTLATPVTDTATANRKVHRADSLVLALNPSITDTAAQLSYLTALTNRQKDTCEAYWYHTDHLGSSSWITDSAGNPVQHLHYLPWGEDFVNQRTTDFSARFTFSAKERDPETSLSYFGSRYYSSDLSIWLSVDPMSDKYAYQSNYVYCSNNPIKMIDPNGEDESPIITTEGKLKGVDNQGWCGMPIVMKEEDYHENMSHEEALNVGCPLDEYGEGIAEHTGCRMYPYVKNNSDETIYYKPEGIDNEREINYNPGYEETEAYEIGPHKDLYARIDGIKTSRIPEGKVYKVPTGFRVVVNRRGVPDIKDLPFECLLKFTKRAGIIDSPDSGWNKLRDSKPIVR